MAQMNEPLILECVASAKLQTPSRWNFEQVKFERSIIAEIAFCLRLFFLLVARIRREAFFALTR
jgi:hypothetical protein